MDTHSQHSSDGLAGVSLPAVRATPEEARAVIDLWQQEQIDSGGLTSRPSLGDIAEGLDIAPEDAHRLLAQVRRIGSGAASQEASIAREHRKLARRIGWGTAAGGLSVLLVYYQHYLMYLLQHLLH